MVKVYFNKLLYLLALIILFLFNQCAIYAANQDWPRIVAPPGSNVQWVAKDIVQNGVPMQIQTFSSRHSVDQVLSHYRSVWSDSKFKPVENNLGDWQILGKQIGDYYLTVQVKDGNASVSEGFLAVSKLPVFDGDANLNESFPRLGGTKVVSDTRSNDDGKIAETLVLENGYSIQSNVGFYEGILPNKGWKKRQSRTSTKSTKPGHVMYYERYGEACHIVINQNREGNTVVLINLSATKI